MYDKFLKAMRPFLVVFSAPYCLSMQTSYKLFHKKFPSVNIFVEEWSGLYYFDSIESKSIPIHRNVLQFYFIIDTL